MSINSKFKLQCFLQPLKILGHSFLHLRQIRPPRPDFSKYAGDTEIHQSDFFPAKEACRLLCLYEGEKAFGDVSETGRVLREGLDLLLNLD